MVYLYWVVLIALGFWFLVLSREAFLTASAYYAGDSFVRGWQARFLDKIFVLFVGVGVLVFFYATEGYLRAGVEKGDVLRRFAKVSGGMILAVFVVDLVLLLLQNLTGVWLRWVVIVAELGLGVGLSWIGRRPPATPTEPPPMMNQANSQQS